MKMVFVSKKILIASAIFNVFVLICFYSLAAHCSGKFYVLNKVIGEQNESILEQTNKLAEQNKTIVKIQSIKVDQSKKIDDLKKKIIGKLDAYILLKR